MTGAPPVRRVIVGTAGHIDHGKTTLVERLTGTRTDRLPEEQARGMTIDVGYAEFRLDDGTEVGLIDVPGHERLVRTMVAGATSMDLVLLVVAADDGPMPQTREHVDILDLLGVPRALVALTKVDIAGPARTAAVAAEIRTLLAGTALEGAPVLPVSSVTGEGLDALRAALAAALPPDRVQAGGDPRAFRMPILRSFAVEGRGTVVTGVPQAGALQPGDAVEVLPPGWAGRVKGVQVHHRRADGAAEGQRTAVLVPDLGRRDVERGMVLVAAGSQGAVERVAALVRVLPRAARPLKHAQEVRLHLGASDVPVRLHLLLSDALAPGALAAVELHALAPLVTAPGDRFVLRTGNDSDTLAGGVVLGLLAQRLARRRPDVEALWRARASRVHDPSLLVVDAVADAAPDGLSLDDLARRTALRADALPALLSGLVGAGRVLEQGRRWFTPAGFAALRERVLSTLKALHAADPAQPFVAPTRLAGALRSLAPAALEAALTQLRQAGEVREDAQRGLAWARHAQAPSPDDQRRCDRVLAHWAAHAGMPPDLTATAAALGLSRAQAERTLKLLEACHDLVRTGPILWHAGWFADARERIVRRAQAGPFTVSEACALLKTTRRYALPFLEGLDRQGVTKREGALRVLRFPRPG